MPADRPAGPAKARGFALLIVLWSMVLLALLLTQVTATGRGQAQLAGNLVRAAGLRAVADGAVHEAAFHLADTGPGRWFADGTTRALPPPPGIASIAVQVDDEAAKANLNVIEPGFLTLLLRTAGAAPQQADGLAAAIVEWRNAPADGHGAATQRYQAAGLAYAPAGRFETIDELGMVIGMTPALLTTLRPELTLYGDGAVEPRYAGPLVRRALALAGVPPPPPAPPTPPSAATITARVQGVGGGVFIRRAVVSLASQPFRILTWTALAD